MTTDFIASLRKPVTSSAEYLPDPPRGTVPRGRCATYRTAIRPGAADERASAPSRTQVWRAEVEEQLRAHTQVDAVFQELIVNLVGLTQELSVTLDRLNRFRRHIAQASDRPEILELLERVLEQEEGSVARITRLIAQEVENWLHRIGISQVGELDWDGDRL